MKYLMERLAEPSTWRGIFAALTGFGIAISPEQAASFTATGLAIIGLIGVLSKDKK
jgi:uncharacterized membrane protein